MGRRNEQGFSLVELFTVIGIIAVLSGIAYPVIASLIPGARLRASGQEVYRALQTARTEAIKLNRKVTVDFERMKCGDGIPPVTGVEYAIHYIKDRTDPDKKTALHRGVLPPTVAVCEDRSTMTPETTTGRDVLPNKKVLRASFRPSGIPVTGGQIPFSQDIYLLNMKKRGLTVTLDQSGSVMVKNKTEKKKP